MKQILRLLLLLLAFGPPSAVWAQTCNQTSLVDYRGNPSTTVVDYRSGATETVSGTSGTFGSYTGQTNPNPSLDVFGYTTASNAIDGRALIWRQNYNLRPAGTADVQVNNNTPYRTQVTFTFSRPVTNLSFVVQDIDKGRQGSGNTATEAGSEFTDELTFYALNNATQVNLTAADIQFGDPTINEFVSTTLTSTPTSTITRTVQGVRGIGRSGLTNTPDADRTANVTITFPAAVTSVTMYFRNLNTSATSAGGGTATRLHSVGIEQISWCGQADVATTLAGPATAPATSTVTYVATITNNGVDVANSVRPTVQLSTGLTNVTGGDYVSNTGLLTLAPIAPLANGASVTRNITFTMPATTATGRVSVPATGNGSTTAGNSANDVTTANNNGLATNANVTTISTPATTLSGTIFDDVNYGGGAGRLLSTAATSATNSGFTASIGSVGTTVELYRNNGTLAATTTTTTGGAYTFTGVAAGSYTVRVVNSTVNSMRNSAAATVGVQTFRTNNGTNDVNRVGGEAPEKIDAAANTGSQTLGELTSGSGAASLTPQSISTVTVAATPVTGVDFGFNFDVVVNNRDAGQGSLRQFMLNSNLLGSENLLAQSGSRTDGTGAAVALPAGKETSIFMIPGTTAVAGLRSGLISGLTNGVAIINTISPLTISGASATNTVIDGGTQTFNLGTAAGNTNAGIIDIPGSTAGATTTTVGVDGLTVQALQRPEVEISGADVNSVIDVEATNTTVRGLAIHGGNVAPNGTGTINDGQAILVGNATAAGSYLLENNLVGVTATGIRPTVANTISTAFGIKLNSNAGAGITQNNYVAYTGNSGINVTNTGTTAISEFVGNQFFQNGYTSSGGDGITFGDKGASGPALVQRNLFSTSSSSGLQFEIGSTAATRVLNNTFINAGLGGQTASALERAGIVYLQRTGSITGTQADVISRNIITNSQSAGIVVGYGQQNVTISQNSISTNATLGIDLITNPNYFVPTGFSGNGGYGDGDGVTLNTGTTNNAFGNRGLDFPVITAATIVGSDLLVKGFARPGVTAEFFIRDNDAGNFGEGQTYLGSGVENGTGDLNTATTTVSYSGTINGLNQGADGAAMGFTFSLPIGLLTPAQLTALTTNGVTATATLSGAGTSEFSGRARTNTAPVPNTLTNVNIPDTNGATVLNPNLSGAANGTLANGTANSISYYTITSLPATGTLTYGGTVLTAANIATTQIAATTTSLNTLTYTPVFGVPSIVSFTYTATDANGVTSVSNNNAGTPGVGAATYTIPVTDVADVTTVVTGPATLNAGQPTGTYIASFTNNGPNSGVGVMQKVTLPVGATLTTAQQQVITNAYPGTTYNQSTRELYFTGVPTTLANRATNSFSFVFTAPMAVGSSTLNSNVTTSTGQGANTAVDAFPLTVNTNAVANVRAEISGNGPRDAGITSTFTVTYSNIGLQAAANVVPTLQLPAGLRNVLITPATGFAFVYDSDSGVITITKVGGGAITFNPNDSFVSTIEYTQPAAPVTATAAISTSTNEAGQTANNSAAATISPNTSFDVATSISGPTTATSGGLVVYNVMTANRGVSAAPNVVQTVTLPAGATNIFVTGGATISGTTVTFPAIASLAGGQTVNNTVSFTQPNTGSYTVGASVTPTDAIPGNNMASVALTVSAPPVATTFANAFVRIAVGTSAAPATEVTAVAANTPITFTVTQGNDGRDAATGVVTRVSIPAGLPVGGANALRIGGNNTPVVSTDANGNTIATYGTGTAAITYNQTTGLVTFASTATQPTGSANYKTYTLAFNAPVSGVVTATANVSTTTTDNVPANNLATTQVTVNPALTDVATALIGPKSATAGSLLTYTVTTTTNGPAPAANVVQTVAIPAGLPVAGATALSIGGNNTPTLTTNLNGQTIATYGTGNAAITYNQSTGIVTFATIDSQTVGASVSNTIAYYAPGNGNVDLTNVASVTTTSPEALITNNSDVVATALQPIADVQVAINGPTSAFVGNTLTYTVVTTNNGPSVAATGTNSNVVTTVQLPSNLPNVVVRGTSGGVISGAYNATSGLVTFDAQSNQAPGGLASTTGSITFDVPANTNLIQPTATATVTGTPADAIASNNTATIATIVKQASTTPINLGISVNSSADYAGTSPNPTSLPAGSPVTFTVTARTNTAVAATNVAPTLQLPAGFPVTGADALKVNNAAPASVNATTGIATYPDNSTYNPATGLVTFAVVNLAGNNSLVNKVTVIAPGTTPLVGTAAVVADQSETGVAANVATRAQPIATAPDVATTVTGPTLTIAGAPVTYTVVTSNAGLSPLAGVAQTVTLPLGVTTYSINGGALVTTTAGATITLPVPTNMFAGAANSVTNTLTFNAPAAAFNVVANVTATNESSAAGNNVSMQPTAIINKAPVAANIVNSLQAPESNSAGQLSISSLSATDPEGNAIGYTVTKAPNVAQGRLYYSDNGTYTLVGDNQTLSAAQASTLKFDPAAGFIGNATFLYSATDALGAVSNTATYLVPVGADNMAVYQSIVKGGNANQYQNGNVVAYGIDPNGAAYNTAGLIYNADGTTAAGVTNNGIRFGKLSVADSTALAAVGVRYTSATGLFTVVDRTLLPRAGRSIIVEITTLDLFGGITTQLFNLELGANPLPVELTSFTATAVKNVDAQLVWTTASERNNDHFDVERSLNGTDYVKISQVKGQGNASSATNYTLTDAGVGAKASGLVYYRLRQVDIDGKAEFSPIRTVAFTKALAPAIALFPNPATSGTQLDLTQLPTGSYQVSVLDATGRVVLASTLEAGLAHALNLNTIASGTYMVLVRGQQNGQTVNLTKRLIKE